jgi:UDP-2,3-diacylglucosamine pyrophosphatase LpxH
MALSVSCRRYRTVFLSDLHLGSPACRAAAILDFLDHVESERLYLLGDIVDGWRLSRRWYWPRAHAAVLERLLGRARAGVEVVYIPGNHDAFARIWCGAAAAGVRVEREALHVAADGRRYLLAHGDSYDPAAERSRAARLAGDLGYRALMRMDGAWRWVCRGAGMAELSLAALAKRRSAVARRVVARFEAGLAAEAARRGFDGVVCGHIHSPASRILGGVAYVNCGDWVESLSAAVESFDGALDVLQWRQATAERARRRLAVPRLAPA